MIVIVVDLNVLVHGLENNTPYRTTKQLKNKQNFYF